MFRAKERAMKYSKTEENSTIEKSSITGTFVDSRKDNTLMLMHDAHCLAGFAVPVRASGV